MSQPGLRALLNYIYLGQYWSEIIFFNSIHWRTVTNK